MRSILLLSLFFSTNSFAVAYPHVPDLRRTPGDLCTTDNPDFSEYRYDERIPYCERNVSSDKRKQIYRTYGIPSSEQGQYTIDHLIPLSIGGSNDASNLWPENKEVKATRPYTEQRLYELVRCGKMTQDEAVDFILKCKFERGTCDIPEQD